MLRRTCLPPRSFGLRLLAMLLCALLPAAALAQEDGASVEGTVDLSCLISVEQGETAHLLLTSTWFSGGSVYRGGSGSRLEGACAIHAAAVVVSNRSGMAVTGQAIAEANNLNMEPGDWSNFVSWGRVGSPWRVTFDRFNLADYLTQLKRAKTPAAERRQMLLDKSVEIMRANGRGVGVVIQFNRSGQKNGADARHAVVAVGWIDRGGVVTDLLVNDSSVASPRGACVRLSESTIPERMLGASRVDALREDGSSVPGASLEYAVTLRWAQ